MLEVVGIRGVVHMGQIQGGLSSAIRLAQGGRVRQIINNSWKKWSLFIIYKIFKIKIRMNTEIPVHVDGEPWLQSPCAITILKSALKVSIFNTTWFENNKRNFSKSNIFSLRQLC